MIRQRPLHLSFSLVWLMVLITSCTRHVYVYQTDRFELPPQSRIYIADNDTKRCSNVFSPVWDLRVVDSISQKASPRQFAIKQHLSAILRQHSFEPTNLREESDFTIQYQDYWLCRRKQFLGSLAILIQDKQDTTQGALLVSKSFDYTSKFDYHEILAEAVEKITDVGQKSYRLTSDELSRYPAVNDVPRWPDRQLGVSFGYSFGTLPHRDISEHYSAYHQGISIVYGGLDLDIYRNKAFGFGIKTSLYTGGNNQSGVSQLSSDGTVVGRGQLRDNVRAFFAGPTLILRAPFFSYHLLDVVKFSPGYLRYGNQAIRFGEATHYTAQAFAWIFSGGLDVRLTPRLNIGIEPKFTFAGFGKMKINGQSTSYDKKERFNRMDIGLSLKLN